ncbi:MAG: MerR family DNA-binding transcriptional regulator, partial [Halomonas sp.]
MSDHNAAIGIGELARRADCKPETVRYYERVGLVDEA